MMQIHTIIYFSRTGGIHFHCAHYTRTLFWVFDPECRPPVVSNNSLYRVQAQGRESVYSRSDFLLTMTVVLHMIHIHMYSVGHKCSDP